MKEGGLMTQKGSGQNFSAVNTRCLINYNESRTLIFTSAWEKVTAGVAVALVRGLTIWWKLEAGMVSAITDSKWLQLEIWEYFHCLPVLPMLMQHLWFGE